ncbi:MAG: hypothetical protein EOP07_03740 [Proteobacteria bacterium]|nr:MAG: hypothetical protein EOP07_03740 [Pseudomonadota bacterium]
MKNNQDGFTAVAFAIAATALGLATMTVQNYRDQASHKVAEINMERERSKNRDAVVNAASYYKALLAERRGPAGKYIPGIYAVNYFAKDWVMKRNSVLDGVNDFSLENNLSVRVKSSTSTNNVLDKSTKVFKEEKSAKSVADETLQVDILNLQRESDPSEPGYGLQVKFVDVKVSAVDGNAGTMNPVTVRVPVQAPEPSDVKLMYKKTGSGSWAELKNGLSLGSGKYDFKAIASGILVSVATNYDNQGWVMRGVDQNGQPTHEAVSYRATDKDIGEAFTEDLGGTSTLDPNSCTLSAVDGSHTLQLRYYPVGEKPVTLDPIQIKSGGASANGGKKLTRDDYVNQCSAPGECPFIARGPFAEDYPDGSFSAGDIANYFIQGRGSNKTPMGDISGDWTFQEAQHYKIDNQKLCINLDNSNPEGDAAGYFHNGDLTLVSEPSCKPQFLIKRTTCGCVAENTKILMGDGKTEKEIKLITKGEMIWNPLLKKAMPIRKMTVGPEKIPLLKVAVGEQVLSVTGNHPFPTRSGMKTAYSLSAGEEVMVEGQGWVKIGSITAVEAGAKAPNVWNIEVEAPDHDEAAHHYVANGVVTGDLMIQINLQKQAQTAQN